MPITNDFIDQLRAPWDVASGYLIDILTTQQAQLQGLFPVVNTQGNLSGDWTDQPFNPGDFTANPTGSLTGNRGIPYSLCWKIVGPVMHFNAAFNVTINNTTTNEIRVKIPLPAGYALRSLPSIAGPDEDRHRTATVWNGGATAGAAGAFIDISDKLVSIQRWDGNAAANYPTGSVFTGFMVQIPLTQPAGS